MSNFVRNLLILAAVALVVALLSLQVAVLTVGILLQIAFLIAIAVVAYFYWRDFARREIETWSPRAAWVLYGAVGLLVVDIGWYSLAHPKGRNALVFVLVAVACVYAGIRTWREQTRLA
jgi:ABC-type transport system involved in cytochrome c biogenesis permease subunit